MHPLHQVHQNAGTLFLTLDIIEDYISTSETDVDWETRLFIFQKEHNWLSGSSLFARAFLNSQCDIMII